MSFLESLRKRRRKFLDGLEVNEDDINLDLFEDFYPDKAHFIYELLQNAEDAGATEANFHLTSTRLRFEHNGRTFDDQDVRAITGFGFSTKRDDADKIGRFGIGFKAVFLYTASPRIWSPSYAFEITDLVLPSALRPEPGLGEHTRFDFPFNSAKKSQTRAFSEVRDGLEEISDKTLLFLSHIGEIQWRVDGGREGRLLRIPHSDCHLEILREIDGGPTESSHYLRFTEPVDGLERQNIAIAFELELLSKDGSSDSHASLGNKFRIVPAEPGCVAVYFEAAKETSNLRFHLHAPFVPDLSRSSVKDTPANEPLFQQLAGLVARSLADVRDLGLLDREFLAVLPNTRDTIPPQYVPIRDAIFDAMNQKPLTPKHGGGHAPASLLLQAEAGLKALLDRDDIAFLVDGDGDPRDWATAATQRNSDVDWFLRDLDIGQWGVEQFVETLDERCSKGVQYIFRFELKKYPEQQFLDWMGSKPADWHRTLYALLNRGMAEHLDLFQDVCIVRRSDGEYGTGSECYFPTPETREDPIHPRVDENTYAGDGSRTEQTHARAFLEGIGVREIGEYQEVEAILRHRYADPACTASWKIHESDLRRFIALMDEDKAASSLFEEYVIFQGADGQWYRPNGIYLDAPYLDTGLATYYGPLESEADRRALSDGYATFDMLAQFIDFVRACGVTDRLEIATVSCAKNPKLEYLHSAPGAQFTQTGIDRDFVIPKFETLFQEPTLDLSRLIWKTLCDRSKNETILRATFRYNQSNCPHYADSQLVRQLRNTRWVPQRGNEFVRPANALRDLLPDGFPFDPGWGWLSSIHFGAKTKKRAEELRRTQALASELGFHDETALDDARRFVELDPEIRQSILAEHREPVDLPTHQPRNRSRRAESVRDEAKKAAPRRSEVRERSVSINRDPTKREKTDPYLLQQYTNPDGVTICQMCRDRLPFRLADGSYYFEAVEFLPELKRHHHQNYLALCPNHAAMFRYANASKDEMKDRFLTLDGSALQLMLADQTVAVYFTETHIADLRIVIEVDGKD